MRFFFCSLALWGTGCAHSTFVEARRADALVAEGSQLQLPSPLRLSPAMLETAITSVGHHGTPWERLVRLNRFLRDPHGLGFTYFAEATRTAEEAFTARNGDCLSYANLFVALGRALNIPVHFVRIREAQFFDERGGQFVVVSHVAVFYADTSASVLVEYSGQAPSWKVSDYETLYDDEAVALHYSNLAMEELARGGATVRPLQIMELLMRLAPTVPEVHNNYAAVLLRQHRPEAAMAVLENGMRRFPTFAPMFLNASQAARALGEMARSTAYAEEARSSRSDPFMPFIRGARLMEQGHYAAAEQLLARAQQLKPDSVTFGAYLTKAQWLGGKRREAKETLDALKARAPGHPLVRYLTGGALRE